MGRYGITVFVSGASSPMHDHHAGLIYTMVLVSAADAEMSDQELAVIGDLVRHTPIFADFDVERLPATARVVTAMLMDSEGLDSVLNKIRELLPAQLIETAYVLACDVAAADGRVGQEELRLLEMLRDRLDIERLPAAAIERAARARHRRFDASIRD